MGRRVQQGRRRKRIFLISVPFLALALLVGIYYIATVSPQPAEDFVVPIAIQIDQMYSGTVYLSNVVPKYVGVSGGIWYSHQYDSYGLNGHYPIFAQAAQNGNQNYSIIHVKSRVVWTFTLQDFFNVWGESLSRNNTLGYAVPPPASDSRYTSDWYWDMCVSINGGRFYGGSWTNQPLFPTERIVLRYSNDGCLPIS